MKQTILTIAILLIVTGCTMKPASSLEPVDRDRTAVEREYGEIELRILDRIVKLKATHASLARMSSPLSYEYNVTWVLENPAEPHDRLNPRYAVFGENGYWFSLQFYRGQWQGAAVFRPVEFGDLKLWFRYGHGGNTSVIAAINAILQEESEAFRERHRSGQ